VYDWCVANFRNDILERWDYDLNNNTPQHTRYCASEVWLKCPNGLHKSEKKNFRKISSRKNTKFDCLYCNSFAQNGIDKFGKDFLGEYWDFDKNSISPWEISKSSHQRVWIKCCETTHHGSYNAIAKEFSAGHRCPYCRGTYVHPKDSFGQYHINNTDKDFIEKYWGTKNTKSAFEYMPKSNEKVWIKCVNNPNHGEYLQSCWLFTIGHRCGYCKKTFIIMPEDSAGAEYPEAILLWGTNKKSPFEYAPNSKKKVMWKCENNLHPEYSRSILGSKTANFKCPVCSAKKNTSALQNKVSSYLESLGYLLKHEHRCTILPVNPKTKHSLPYDNEICKLKLIIEVHGQQHYLPDAYRTIWKRDSMTPDQLLHKRKLYDRYKKLFALSKGYFYLEIPYWTEKDESYKNLIDDKISEILKIKNKQKVS